MIILVINFIVNVRCSIVDNKESYNYNWVVVYF